MTGEANDGVGPLVFHDRPTEADVVDLYWQQLRLWVRRPYRWLAYGLVAGVSVMMLAFIAINGPDVTSVLFLIASAYLLVGLPFERAWTARRYYHRHLADFVETEVRLTPERVSIVNETQRAEFAWRLLGGVVETRTGILFYNPARTAMIWLPVRLFADEALRRRVVALALSNGVQVTRD